MEATSQGPRAAIFVRVSKSTQNYERQVRDLTEIAQRQGWRVVAVVHEKGSATKRKNIDRPELEQLMELARTNQIDKVVVTESSRLGRRPGETRELIEQLMQLKVSVYAHNIGVETLDARGRRSFAAMLMLAIYAERDAEEAELLSERSRSGQANSKAKGVHIGRKKGTIKSDEEILAKYPDVARRLRRGESVRSVAANTKKSKGTVERVKKILDAESKEPASGREAGSDIGDAVAA